METSNAPRLDPLCTQDSILAPPSPLLSDAHTYSHVEATLLEAGSLLEIL